MLETRCFPFPDDSGFGFFLNVFLAKGQAGGSVLKEMRIGFQCKVSQFQRVSGIQVAAGLKAIPDLWKNLPE